MKFESIDEFQKLYSGKHLSYLKEGNKEFDRIVSDFHKRKNVANEFVTIHDFIDQEIQRVSNSFIKPMRIIPDRKNAAIWNFINYSKYQEQAYKWLNMGQDYSIESIVKNAWHSIENPNPKYPTDLVQFYNGVVDNLRVGVAYIMYERFLRAEKERLKKDNPMPSGTENDVNEIMNLFASEERKQFDDLITGFQKMEAYINKNVHQIVKPTLERSKQLNRNLTNWLYLLRSIYINPINEEPGYIFADDLNRKKGEIVRRLEEKLVNALEIIKLRIDDKVESKIPNPVKVENENNENDFLKSTIEDYLEVAKGAFNHENDLNMARDRILNFFHGSEISCEKRIFIKSGYKKRLGQALGSIYKSHENAPLSFKYLDFARSTFTIYSKEKVDEQMINRSNLYKYFTNKT